MEGNEKSGDAGRCSSVINKTSISNSNATVGKELQFKKKFQKRHILANGNGFVESPRIGIEEKNCSLTTINKRRKAYVLPEHIEMISKDPPLYKCTICNRSFKRSMQGKYHESCLTGRRPLICEICDKGFITKSHLAYHLRTHSDYRPFVCKYCSKSFAQKDKLKRHISMIHLQERPHACTLCDRKFTSKQVLQVHMRGHLRQRPFQCDLCLRRFSSKTVLQRHRLTHSGIRNFACSTCGKKFTMKSDLNIHLRIHSGIRPYACTVSGCSKSFTLKTSYTRHLQTHSDVHDYECSICVAPFRRKDNLERHMKNFHPESMVAGHSQQIVSIVQPKPLGSKKANKKDGLPKRLGETVIENKPGLMTDLESDGAALVHMEQIPSSDSAGENRSYENNVEGIESCSKSSSSVIVKAVKVSEDEPQTKRVLSSEVVSVINRGDKVPSEENKQEQTHGRKNEVPIVPYRTITRSSKLSDSDRVNCVPTITKVTHIVHTSKTGIPNIQTVITTRDVTKNKTKQSKDSNNGSCMDRSNVRERIETVERPKRTKSVINYVPRNLKNRKSVECYRVLKPSSEFFTTCSNLGNGLAFSQGMTNSYPSGGNFGEIFDGRREQMYSSQGSLANAFKDLCQELLSEDTSNRGDASNLTQDARTKMADFNRTLLQHLNESTGPRIYEPPEVYPNRLQPYDGGMVSESCLLADNALDHNITDSLYEEQLNNNLSSYNLAPLQNMEQENGSDITFPQIRPPYLDTQQEIYNYPNSMPTNIHNYDYQQNDNYNMMQSYSGNGNDSKCSNYSDEELLQDLRFNSYDYMAPRASAVPSPARSVIVDHPKTSTAPSSYVPRLLPLKKCLWTKSTFGGMLNDSPEVN